MNFIRLWDDDALILKPDKVVGLNCRFKQDAVVFSAVHLAEETKYLHFIGWS